MLKGLGTSPGVIHALMFKYSRDTNRLCDTHSDLYYHETTAVGDDKLSKLDSSWDKHFKITTTVLITFHNGTKKIYFDTKQYSKYIFRFKTFMHVIIFK